MPSPPSSASLVTLLECLEKAYPSTKVCWARFSRTKLRAHPEILIKRRYCQARASTPVLTSASSPPTYVSNRNVSQSPSSQPCGMKQAAGAVSERSNPTIPPSERTRLPIDHPRGRVLPVAHDLDPPRQRIQHARVVGDHDPLPEPRPAEQTGEVGGEGPAVLAVEGAEQLVEHRDPPAGHPVLPEPR